MTTLSSQTSQSRVSTCVANVIAYIFRKLRCSVLQHIHLPQIIILWETNFPVLLDIAFIHDAVFFFLHVSVFWVSSGVFRAQHGAHFTVTHVDKLFIRFGFIRKKLYLVSPLVIPGNVGYPS